MLKQRQLSKDYSCLRMELMLLMHRTCTDDIFVVVQKKDSLSETLAGGLSMKRYVAIAAASSLVLIVHGCSLIAKPDRCLIPEDQREGDDDCPAALPSGGTGGTGGTTTSNGGGGTGGTGGDAGNGGSTTSNGGGGSGGAGGQGGSTTSNGGGGTGGTGGQGGTGGSGGTGGQGGSGGGPTCMDPPENPALNIECTDFCLKVLVWDAGVTIDAESSNDDGLCESTQPFITHPGSGQYAMVWVNDPLNAANLDSFTAQSLGSYPSVCSIKCCPDPLGAAPNHSEMETQLLNGGYTTVACGANPAVSLGQVCPFGMCAVLQY